MDATTSVLATLLGNYLPGVEINNDRLALPSELRELAGGAIRFGVLDVHKLLSDQVGHAWRRGPVAGLHEFFGLTPLLRGVHVNRCDVARGRYTQQSAVTESRRVTSRGMHRGL